MQSKIPKLKRESSLFTSSRQSNQGRISKNPSRNLLEVNTIEKNSISTYLNRRHKESQDKIKRLKEELLRKEDLNLRFKPSISRNSQRIVEKIMSRKAEHSEVLYRSVVNTSIGKDNSTVKDKLIKKSSKYVSLKNKSSNSDCISSIARKDIMNCRVNSYIPIENSLNIGVSQQYDTKSRTRNIITDSNTNLKGFTLKKSINLKNHNLKSLIIKQTPSNHDIASVRDKLKKYYSKYKTTKGNLYTTQYLTNYTKPINKQELEDLPERLDSIVSSIDSKLNPCGLIPYQLDEIGNILTGKENEESKNNLYDNSICKELIPKQARQLTEQVDSKYILNQWRNKNMHSGKLIGSSILKNTIKHCNLPRSNAGVQIHIGDTKSLNAPFNDERKTRNVKPERSQGRKLVGSQIEYLKSLGSVGGKVREKFKLDKMSKDYVLERLSSLDDM